MSKEGVDLEEDYFARQDREKIEKLKAKAEAEHAGQEAAALKALHYLHCGKCGTKMDTKTFKGVEIEICPTCGAVLLDSGELEALAGKDETGVFDTIADLFSFSNKQRG